MISPEYDLEYAAEHIIVWPYHATSCLDRDFIVGRRAGAHNGSAVDESVPNMESTASEALPVCEIRLGNGQPAALPLA